MSQIPVVHFSSFIPTSDAMPVRIPTQQSQSESKKATVTTHTDNSNGNSSPRKYLYGVFGLGNPGEQYKGTRHNIGREIVERMSEDAGISLRAKGVAAAHVHSACKATYVKSHITEGSQYDVLLVTPNTFMNLSGISVRGICDMHGIWDKHVIVIYDDVDLPLGTLRIKDSGSSGGQKGAEDVIRRMNKNGRASKFIRIRVGVGNSLGKKARGETSDFVLGRFHGSNELPLVDKTMKRVANCVHTIVTQGFVTAQNQFNMDAAGFANAEAKALTNAAQAQSVPQTGSKPHSHHSPDATKLSVSLPDTGSATPTTPSSPTVSAA